MGLFYALKSTVNPLNRLPMMPHIIYGPIFNIECIKKGFPSPQGFGFCNFTEKIQTLGGWESFFYTFNIKNRTIYDIWHHGKNVEGVNSGFQCIKKFHKNLI